MTAVLELPDDLFGNGGVTALEMNGNEQFLFTILFAENGSDARKFERNFVVQNVGSAFFGDVAGSGTEPEVLNGFGRIEVERSLKVGIDFAGHRVEVIGDGDSLKIVVKS